MNLHLALAAAAALLSLAFALSTLERWIDRRKPHEGAWTVALFLFSAASVALWGGAAFGWNGAWFRLFYLFGAVLKPVPWLAAAIVGVLAVLSFAPFKFVHPMRVARMRAPTIAALLLWSLLAVVALLRDLDPGPWVAGGLVVIALYFLGVGLTEKR